MRAVTAGEFNTSLHALGWTKRMLAQRLGCDHALVQHWARGTLPVPQQILAWLTRLRMAQAQVGDPVEWR